MYMFDMLTKFKLDIGNIFTQNFSSEEIEWQRKFHRDTQVCFNFFIHDICSHVLAY